MYVLDKRFFKTIRVNNIWIFITDRCNLDCDYCFFSQKSKTNTLSIAHIATLLKALPKGKRYDFVLSGGEPLLCWNTTKKAISYFAATHPKSSSSLQTNMLLFSRSKIPVLAKHRVTVEPGIDGKFLSTARHRRGFTPSLYKKCLQNMQVLVQSNLVMNPTMTVHPQETSAMEENFNILASMGLRHIEVHPAFGAPWTRKTEQLFIRQYKRILEHERKQRQQLICKSYSMPVPRSIDLVIQPDGYILPNWTFLSFPYRLRKEFFIMKLLKTDILLLPKNLTRYLRALSRFFKKERTYREFSNFNASLILKRVRRRKTHKEFHVYNRLTNHIQRIDRMFLNRGGLSGQILR